MSKNDILDQLYRSYFMDDLIDTITSKNKLKSDLKQELFVILCEMPEWRIKRAWSNNYLNYMCINILKKQYHSSTSPFHKKYRAEKFDELTDWNSSDELFNIVDSFENTDEVMDKIKWIVENKLDMVDRELFKLYYKWDRYDRWVGDLRDDTCEKEWSSYRKIERKLTIMPIEGGKKIGISRNTISLSHQRSIEKIKNWLLKL